MTHQELSDTSPMPQGILSTDEQRSLDRKRKNADRKLGESPLGSAYLWVRNGVNNLLTGKHEAPVKTAHIKVINEDGSESDATLDYEGDFPPNKFTV